VQVSFALAFYVGQVTFYHRLLFLL